MPIYILEYKKELGITKILHSYSLLETQPLDMTHLSASYPYS